jgi:phosphoribosylanthranilate isomerase
MSLNARTRSKICGLTRVQDVRCAVQAGADAIGFVFFPPSPRAVTATQAIPLVQAVPAFVQAVGLFVNASAEEIANVLLHVPLDLLQLHGEESPEHCREIAAHTGRRWIKALAVKPDVDIAVQIAQYSQAGASAILLDAWHPQLKGGTGQSFDWSVWPQTETPLILAGGLNPDNVAQAIAQTRPYAVDVSGGVEAGKGIKDHLLIEQFMRGVQHG